LDWHASVYGSRTGREGGYGDYSGFGGYGDDGESGFGDDEGGVTFGAQEVISDRRLKQLGGPAYYRAYDVISSGRMHDMCVADDEETPNALLLSAYADSADGYADDYEVTAVVDEQADDIVESHCTCPAFGRYGARCKHVIALVMAYNENPRDFDLQGGPLRRSLTQTTTRLLKTFMGNQDRELKEQAKGRHLELLKTVNGEASSSSSKTSKARASADTLNAMQRMPIGSVVLRPGIGRSADGWYLRLRVSVPSRSLSYIVKDISALLHAVHYRESIVYGKKLAFLHTLDSFDDRSREVIAILDKALDIRRGILPYYYDPRLRNPSGQMSLSDNEIADVLDRYVDSGDTVEYLSPGLWSGTNTALVQVRDGDPDLGLSIERAGASPDAAPAQGRAASADAVGSDMASPDSAQAAGFMIRHSRYAEDFIEGSRSKYAIVRAAGIVHNGEGDTQIRRCSEAFYDNRAVAQALCGNGEEGDLFLAQDDVDAFSRTVLPFLNPEESDQAEGDAADTAEESTGAEPVGHAPADPAGGSGPGHAAGRNNGRTGSGVRVRMPAELLRRRPEPCVIEIYLDRDRSVGGVTCDLQARYGDRRFHVFDGIPMDGVTKGVNRDRQVERLAVEAVRHYFPMPQGDIAFLPEHDDGAIYKLISEGIPVLRSLGTVFSTPDFDGLTSAPRPNIRVGLSLRSGLVEISPIADEIDPEDVPGLLNSYRKRRRFHRLRNGAFIDMRDVDAGAVDELASDLGLPATAFDKGPVTVPAFEAYYLDHQVDNADKSDGFKDYLDGLRVIDPGTYRVPDSLRTVLRPYQIEGFRWLNAVCDKGFGGILADEMGLGKTVQLLSLLVSRRAKSREIGPSLIVCPASLVYNWAAECERFAPELGVMIVAGNKASRRAMLDEAKVQYARAGQGNDAAGADDASGFAGGGWQGARTAPQTARTDDGHRIPDVLITSYDLLRRDVDDYQGLECFCMVLDEAQYIKNHATKASKAVRSVAARHRFALTGTPIENRLSELWSIFDFLMPGILGSYAHFRERFEMPILSGDEDVQRKLQAFVGPFILRRLKSTVLKDLPDKIENIIAVPLEGEQRRLYAALEQRLRATLLKQRDIEFATGKIQILAQLTRLRQACCDPRLLYANVGRNVVETDAKAWGMPARTLEESQETAAKRDLGLLGAAGSSAAGSAPGGRKSRKAASAKLDAIAELVSSCQDAGRKMLIFSQFTSYLDLIAERLRAGGVDYDVITGATPKKRRVELVDQFNRDDTPVFLISLKAGNTGLNLTGACVVVHADPWWNAAAQDQATDRAHRIGQTQDVNVYQIVAKDTIEERILSLQHAKSDLASRFVDAASSTGTAVSRLTKDDLLALLD
jgi:SNF2 family DNA or RNA helicase